MVFKESVQVGDLIMCDGEIVYTGRTSMGILVNVRKENLQTGEINHQVMHGYWFMVALDDNGKPTPVPPLKIESPEQQKLFDEVKIKFNRK
jgi:acyl-CoA hydrolase